MKVSLQIYFLILCAFSLKAQQYVPIDTVSAQKTEVYNFFLERTKELENQLKEYPETNRKTLKSFVKDRKEMAENITKNNYLLYDEDLEEYINGLLQQIAKENGIETEFLRIFISRDTNPNAYSLGDGTFVVNISLLHRIEHEDELLFIIAHELAHYTLDHFTNRLRARMKLSSSEEYKRKERELKRNKYRRFTRSLEQNLDLIYENQSFSRQNELQADSLAFKYVQNLISDPQNLILNLEKIDTISPSEIYKIDYNILKEHFSSPSMPFQEKWSSGYDFSKYNYRRGKIDVFGVHKDSLTSHPERKERIAQIEEAISNNVLKSNNKISANFQRLKQKWILEDVYAHYCSNELGKGIYLILQLQDQGNLEQQEELFFKQMLSLFYEKLSEARQSFTFKKYVDDVDITYFTEEYNLFLTILDNLRSSELQAMADKYKS